MTHATSLARRASFALLALTLSLVLPAASAEAVDRSPARASRRAAPPRRAPVAPLSAEERRALAVTRLLRRDTVQRCWARQLYRDPSTTSRRVTVTIAVDREGRITRVALNDAMVPTLAGCIAALGYGVAGVGVGEAFETEATLTFERGE